MNLELLGSIYAPSTPSTEINENFRPSDRRFNVAGIKISIERQKAVIDYALQNDPKGVVPHKIHILINMGQGYFLRL